MIEEENFKLRMSCIIDTKENWRLGLLFSIFQKVIAIAMGYTSWLHVPGKKVSHIGKSRKTFSETSRLLYVEHTTELVCWQRECRESRIFSDDHSPKRTYQEYNTTHADKLAILTRSQVFFIHAWKQSWKWLSVTCVLYTLSLVGHLDPVWQTRAKTKCRQTNMVIN